MPRGGKREGAGGKPKWGNGKTKVIRVPEALVEQVLKFVEFLDKAQDPSSVTWSNSDNVTESKIVNLTGIAIRSLNGSPCVHLSDLIRIGYYIYPEKLANSVKVREGKAQEIRHSELKSDIQSALEQLNILELEK